VIPEPDKVIQVCTAHALRAGIFHDQEPSDPSAPDAREVPPRLDGDQVSKGSFAVTIRRTILCDTS
jgi:hypothetical protein